MTDTTNIKQKAIEHARELVHERQSALFEERRALQKKREELVRELKSIEHQVDGIDRRIGAMRDLLVYDFPAAEHGTRELPWAEMGIPNAAGELLREAGGYLTGSQIRAGLAEHGVDAGDTSKLLRTMEDDLGRHSPLMRVNERLWGRQDWAEEARFSMRHRYREGEN